MTTWWKLAVAAAALVMAHPALASAVDPEPESAAVQQPSDDESQPDAQQAPRPENPRQQAEEAFKEGLAYERRYKFEQAVAAYERSLKLYRQQPEALAHLAGIYQRVANPRKVILYCKELIRMQPDSADGRLLLGEAYVKTGQLALAETQYKKLQALDQEKAAQLRRVIDRGDAAAAPAASPEAPEAVETAPERTDRPAPPRIRGRKPD